MGTFLFLAAEAKEVHESGGFGLNFDILGTNIINLAILIGVLIYFGRKFLTSILSERSSNIAQMVQEAEQRANEGAASLSDAQQKLTQAQAEAQRIRKAAEGNAQSAREAILTRAAVDVERLKEAAAQDLNTETERAIAELRSRVVSLALQRVESQLQSRVDRETQQKLIDRSIALLGGG